MKKTVISLFLLTLMISFSFGQGFVQTGVAPLYGDMFGGTDQLMIDLQSNAGRSILAGTDVDQDGKYEVWITTYAPTGMVYCFEQAGTDTLALVWISDSTTSSNGSTPRDVHIGDLDGDGKEEIIFQVGGSLSADDVKKGIHIYEWDGVTDNGFGDVPAFSINLFSGLNDTLSSAVIENFSIGDIDSDGKQELLLAINGPSTALFGTKDGSTPFSGDRFMILSINGDIGAGFGTEAIIEYQVSPRDMDGDGTNENGLGGGSPSDMVMCDTDGDGFMEAACILYNNLGVFFIESTGPNAYTAGTFNDQYLHTDDDFTLGASVADMDGDGKDEVYVGGYFSDTIFVIKDMDGDALTFDKATESAAIGPGAGFGCTAVAGFGVVVGGSANVTDGEGTDITRFELTGTNVLDPTHWVANITALPDATTGHAFKVSGEFDSDNDGNWEFGLPYQSIIDLVDADGDGNPDGIDLVQNRIFRVVEWDENYVSIKDITFIMPDDYKLEQNYPNPFNPTTTISYTLPLQNDITVNIYNFLGEHVVTLVNGERQQAGVHDVVWNSLDKNGARVPSGTYFYELKYGNFSKTKRMTLLK